MVCQRPVCFYVERKSRRAHGICEVDGEILSVRAFCIRWAGSVWFGNVNKISYFHDADGSGNRQKCSCLAGAREGGGLCPRVPETQALAVTERSHLISPKDLKRLSWTRRAAGPPPLTSSTIHCIPRLPRFLPVRPHGDKHGRRRT